MSQKEPFRFHSDTEQNPDVLYPGAVNSPLRYKQTVADDECEADACDEDED